MYTLASAGIHLGIEEMNTYVHCNKLNEDT